MNNYKEGFGAQKRYQYNNLRKVEIRRGQETEGSESGLSTNNVLAK